MLLSIQWVRRAAGRVADNEQALVADPDPALIEIGREISRLGLSDRLMSPVRHAGTRGFEPATA
jgi:hypothetical protein